MSDIAHRSRGAGAGEDEAATQRSRLTKVTLNLTPKAAQAVLKVAELTGDTRTDIINRAVQVYAEIEQVFAKGGELYVRPEKDADVQQLKIW
jgi:hypothetical protein